MNSSDNHTYTRPLPNKEFLASMTLYECPQMYISVTSKHFSFPSKGSHAHDGYEFLIPDAILPFLGVDNKEFKCSRNDILPINPGQQHGPTDRINDAHFHNIMISRKLIEETAYTVFGRNNVQFSNEISNVSGLTHNLIGMFISEAEMSHTGTSIILGSLSYHIATVLLRELKSNMPCVEKSTDGSEVKRIRKVINYMNEYYNTDCSLKSFAEIAGLSCYHFIRIFKNHTGKTPYEYLIDIRIEKARQMLANKNYSITNVCIECGFNNASHFTRLFRNRTGVTPTYFRSIILN